MRYGRVNSRHIEFDKVVQACDLQPDSLPAVLCLYLFVPLVRLALAEKLWHKPSGCRGYNLRGSLSVSQSRCGRHAVSTWQPHVVGS
jgi:hypothetical protein